MRSFHSSRNAMTPEALEARRMKAVALFRSGVAQATVAKRLGVSRTAVHYWHKAWKHEGREALAKRKQGPRYKLSEREVEHVEATLLRGPEAHGYHTQLWTLARITKAVKEVTGVAYGERSIWHVLRRMGWSCQKPARRAKERNEAAIAHWKKVEWPSIQKRGAKMA